MACSICKGTRKLLCPGCFENADASGAAYSKAELLKERRGERDQALARLQEAVAGREAERRQQLQLHEAEARLARARQRVDDLQAQLQAARQRIQQGDRDLRQRQQAVAGARQQVDALRAQTQRDRTTPMELQGHTYLRNLDTLCREQRHRVVRRAMEIFPLALMPPMHPAPEVNGSHQNPAGTPASAAAASPQPADRALAKICNLLLPDSRDSMAELEALAPQLGSALGYAALLVDVLGRFLLLPVTHRCGFCGATSHVWQPESFWDTATPEHALPLYWQSQRGGQDGTSLYSAVAAGLSSAAGGAGTSGSGMAAEREAARQRQDLQQALLLLQRSVGTLVYARLGPDAALKVPPNWSPFAWLAGLCKMLAAEPRSASSRMAVPGAGRALAASAVFGRPGQHGGSSMGQSVLLLGEDEEAAEGAEEWEVMPRPSYGIIPPPPSQPEDVEHWTRAMMDTASPRYASSVPVLGESPLRSRLRSLSGLLWPGGGSGSGSAGQV